MNDLHGPLPEWFSLLKCLEILDLSNNHIESVRSLYDSTRLFHLDLAYNMLRSVPDRKRLPSLTQLFIQGNPAIQQMPMAPAGWIVLLIYVFLWERRFEKTFERWNIMNKETFLNDFGKPHIHFIGSLNRNVYNCNSSIAYLLTRYTYLVWTKKGTFPFTYMYK